MDRAPGEPTAPVRQVLEGAPGEAGREDVVQQGSELSFPASDPPSWMSPITSLGPPKR